jgi:hypothetical protein
MIIKIMTKILKMIVMYINVLIMMMEMMKLIVMSINDNE